jgi:nucleotide-binding universal stress UspA family protein
MPDLLHNDGGCRIAGFARRVLVPIDFSEASRVALQCAVSLVEQCGASLHLLHVLPELVGAEPLVWHLDARSEIERAIERSALDELRHLLSADDQARLRVRLAVHWGMPGIEILRYTRMHQVDLIAMGRDGRGGIKHLLLGSVADRVTRNAPCAVLSVRHPTVKRLMHHDHSRHMPHRSAMAL